MEALWARRRPDRTGARTSPEVRSAALAAAAASRPAGAAIRPAWLASGAGGATAEASVLTPSARAMTPGALLHVAVTTTPRRGSVSSAARKREPVFASAGPAGPALAPAARARSGSTRIASVRPTACAGQRSSALGSPRYTAWRLKRTHTLGSRARSKTGQFAGTSSRSAW